MIADLKPYPAMKDSGVPWLGEVPVDWEIRRNGRSFAQRNESGFPDLPILQVSLRTAVRVRDLDDGLRKQVMSDRAMYKRAAHGDIAYNMMRMWQGAVGVVPVNGLVSPAYVVARPLSGTVSGYFAYLYRTDAYMGEVDNYSRGIVKDRNRLYWEQFKQIPTPCPPFAEQAAIVHFLDYADRRIRHYNLAKQKLIRLLEEQKRAIIRRAVTRGLDSKVRLKPSGIEWLGDVPEHWEVIPLKRLAWFKSGAGFPVNEQGSQGSEIPFLRVSDMTRDGNETWIETADSTVSRETAARLGAFVFPAGSIIFPKVGGALLTNKRRLLRMPSCIDNNVMGCVVRGADLDYMFVQLQQLDLGRLAKPGPVPAIGEGDVREIKVALPPIREQAVIVKSVRAGVASLGAAISSAQREISLLREYRTRLIADVVTGKLDVREAAAQLPDETKESEPPDEVDAPTETEEAADDELDGQPEEADARDQAV